MTTKSTSLNIRAVLVVTVFLVAMSLILGSLLTFQSRIAMKKLIDGRILDVASTAADMVDGDTLKAITDEDQGTPRYDQIYSTLSSFEKNIGLDYIYATRETEDGSFIFVVDPSTENTSDYGELVHMTDALKTAGQ